MPLSHAAHAFAFQIIAGLGAASMKLIRIGQTACQQIIRRALVLLGEKSTIPSPSPSMAGSIHSLKSPHSAMPVPTPASSSPNSPKRSFRLGVGGPVGSGKTMCVLSLSQWLKDEISLAVITNDIYTRDAKIQRGPRPFLFADLKSEKGKDDLLAWLKHEYLFI